MDCFFVATEIRDNPKLKGKPVAVGGKSSRRGVLSTANYEARKFGVSSAMSTSIALKKCPQLIVLPSRFDVYKEDSRIIRSIFEEHTQKVEPLSLDEAFLDISHRLEPAELIAEKIRKEIYEKTKLTASAGLAPNKFLAKVASDWNKPNGLFIITPSMVNLFVYNLAVSKISGVGKVTNKKMMSLGVKTCGDLQKLSKNELNFYFGKFGNKLYQYARGIDTREVKSQRIRKSLSVEKTFDKDLVEDHEYINSIKLLFFELQKRLQKRSLTPPYKNINLKVKYMDFKVNTFTEHLEFKEESFFELFQKAKKKRDSPIRLIGLGVGFSTSSNAQISLNLEFRDNE